MVVQEIIVLILGFCGGFVRGLTGGAHGMTVMILWSIGSAIGVPQLPNLKQLIACHVFSGIPGGIFFMIFSEACIYGQLGIALPVIIFTNVGAPGGAYLVRFFSERILLILVACILFLILLTQLIITFILRQIRNKQNKKSNNFIISESNTEKLASSNEQSDVNNGTSTTTNNNEITTTNNNNEVSSTSKINQYDEENTTKIIEKVDEKNNNGVEQTNDNNSLIQYDSKKDNRNKKNMFVKSKNFLKTTYYTIQYLFKIFWYIIRGNAKYQKDLKIERVRLIFEFKELQSKQNSFTYNEFDEPLIRKSTYKKSRFIDYLEVTASKGYMWGIKYMIIFCTLAGFMYAMVGLPGPAYLIMQQIIRIPKLEYIGTFATSSSLNFTIVDYVVSGQFRLQDVSLYVCYTIAFVIGLYVGQIGNKKISEIWFQRSLRIVMFVAAIFLLLQGLQIIPSKA